MYKHLKCLLKVIGVIPFLLFLACVFLPYMITWAVLLISGCIKDFSTFPPDEVFGKAADWYRSL